MHLNTVTVWDGEPNTAWSKGEKYGNGKKYHFSFPHKFFTSFLITKRKKLDQGGKYYIVSPQAHIKEAVYGEKHRHRGKTLTQRERIFSPSTPPVKVEQLIEWPRREKIKTQGEKISYIFPQLEYADTVTKKDCVQREKYHFILSLLFSFPLSFLSFSTFFRRARYFFAIFSPSGIFILNYLYLSFNYV
jgi:hypothetical protein